MNSNVILIWLFVFTGLFLQAQDRKVNIAPFPVIATNPTLGLVLGFSPGFTWNLGDPEHTSMSSAIVSLLYTSNNQLLFNLRGNNFLPGDTWNLMADLRYQITSQPTYGLGTQAKPAYLLINNEEELPETKYLNKQQMMEYDCVRAYFTALKRYSDTRFFFGLGYHLDIIYNIDDHLLNLDTLPRRITQHYRYNSLKNFSTESNTVSGVSLNAMYDSRDNIANPYKGRYAFVNFRLNPVWIGSTQASSTLWLEYRDYFNLSSQRPRHLIGLWTFAWFVSSGNLPYMNLPAIGWDMFSRSGRAYTSGRFRGEDLLYSEVEYRFPLQRHKETLGGVVFINSVSASSRTENIHLMSYINMACGVGFRLMINKKSRSSINFDYAWASNGSNGFFVALNEAF